MDVRRILRAAAAVATVPVTAASVLWLREIRGRVSGRVVNAILRRAGMWVVTDHYYEPMFDPAKLAPDHDEPRVFPSLDLDEAGQLALLKQFRWADELAAFPERPADDVSFGYENGMFGPGDADFYYSMIRLRKPKRIVEIGSGFSTRLAVAAVARNRAEGNDCEITCVEPYEQPNLERLPVKVIRQRVETLDVSLFALEAGDILFIDSSHIIRPGGDVAFEILQLLPRLPAGVMVHVHDLFTPWNYPRAWMDIGHLWNEQYMLEAFLAGGKGYRVVGALYWLSRLHPDATAKAMPGMLRKAGAMPTSFWLERTAVTGG